MRSHIFHLQSDTCTISIPELDITSTENRESDLHAREDFSVDVLKEVLGADVYVPSDKNGNNDNIKDAGVRSCGNFTTIEGLLEEILKLIEKKKIVAGICVKNVLHKLS